MNNFKTGKKFLALVLAVVMAFSGISVYAAESFDGNETDASDVEVILEHEHVYGQWTVTLQQTCKNPGEKVAKCVECAATKSEIIPAEANAHVPGNEVVIKSATCTLNGISQYTCKECSEKYQVETTKLGHVFDTDEDGNPIVTIDVAPVHEHKYYKDGVGYKKCTRCEDTFEETIYVEHDFRGATPDIIKAPSCSANGVKYTVCNICDYSIRELIPVDKDAHVYSGKPIIKEGETLNCQTDAKGSVVCEACDSIIEEIIIPKEKAHNYIEWQVTTELPANATCSNQLKGYETKYCETCDKVVDKREITAPHNFEKVGKDGEVESTVSARLAATCSKRGSLIGDCVDCGQKNVVNYTPIDENAHKYIELVKEAPTCTEEGLLLIMCQYDANHCQEVVVEATGHTYKTDWEILKAATCQESGLKRNHCTVCNEDITEEIPLDSNAHVVDGQTWTVDEGDEATCYKTGKAKAKCAYANCGGIVEKEIPVCYNTGYEYIKTEPTCSDEGKVTYICRICGSSRQEIIPVKADAHTPSEDIVMIYDSTCAKEGLKAIACVDCGIDMTDLVAGTDAYKEPEAIPVKDHVLVEVIDEEPVCKDGAKYHKCINCDEYKSNDIVMSAQHNYTAWSNVDPDAVPTCKTPISRTRHCINCDAVDTDNKYYGTHVEGKWIFTDGATCETGGVAVKVCSECGATYDEKTVAAGAHADLVYKSEDYSTTETTCYGKKYKCNTCDKTISVVNAHSFITTQNGYEPTCVLPGMTEAKYCAVCKINIEQSVIAPLGHDYDYDSNGSKLCSRCHLYAVEDNEALVDTCNHFCHNNGIVAKVLKIVCGIFWKMLGTNHFCKCGVSHYHDGVKVLSYEFNALGQLNELTYSCEECEAKEETYKF